nr:hypothetical protein OG461_13230 [Streptomyces sp. NBC_00995]
MTSRVSGISRRSTSGTPMRRVLRRTVDVPESVQALKRIAADPAVDAEVRGLAADGLPGS